MRRDTQIGVILGVVILVVIGVFLSTRTSPVKEAQMPNLVLSEKEITEPEIEEIDINELIRRQKAIIAQENSAKEERLVQEREASEKYPGDAPVRPSGDSTSLEGKWEGVKEEAVESEKVVFDSSAPDETVKESPKTQPLAVKEEKTVVVPEVRPKVAPVATREETVHKVRPNDNLFKIAKEYYDDETKWKRIYEANKSIMANPNSLYVGQSLVIPDLKVAKQVTPLDKKSVKKVSTISGTHTVEPGDTLYSLARKYYHDSNKWVMIYEANEHKIESKGLLRKGQILVIPEIR